MKMRLMMTSILKPAKCVKTSNGRVGRSVRVRRPVGMNATKRLRMTGSSASFKEWVAVRRPIWIWNPADPSQSWAPTLSLER